MKPVVKLLGSTMSNLKDIYSEIVSIADDSCVEVVYDFNNISISSEMTLDEVFVKVVGMTYNEYVSKEKLNRDKAGLLYDANIILNGYKVRLWQ